MWNKVARSNTNDLNEYVGIKNKTLQYQCFKCLKIMKNVKENVNKPIVNTWNFFTTHTISQKKERFHSNLSIEDITFKNYEHE